MNNIALICDDNYSLPTAVCIQSIIDNTFTIDNTIVHVCTFGLTKDNQKTIQSLSCEKVRVVIDQFIQDDYTDLLNQVNQKTHVSLAALIKFEMPNRFKELDRILYLDSDIIIKKDISGIFETDLSHSYLAASFEFWNYLNYRNYSLKNDYDIDFYFNSGVMLFNLEKMRADNITQKLWDYKINHAKTPLMDQESFNALCGSTAVHLSIKWNFNPVFATHKNIIHINAIYGEKYDSVQSMLDDVIIIHYVGKKDKPWNYSNAHMVEYWDKAFENSKIVMELQRENYQKQFAPIKKLLEMRKQYGTKATFNFMISLILKR